MTTKITSDEWQSEQIRVASVDCVVMLPGWPRSKGARIEFILAKLLGLTTYPLKKKGSIPL